MFVPRSVRVGERGDEPHDAGDDEPDADDDHEDGERRERVLHQDQAGDDAQDAEHRDAARVPRPCRRSSDHVDHAVDEQEDADDHGDRDERRARPDDEDDAGGEGEQPEEDEQPPEAAEVLQGVGDVRGHGLTSAGGRASGGKRYARGPVGSATSRARRPAFDAADLVEHGLAQPDRLGRHLDALVLAQELERLVEREDLRGHEPLEHVGRGRAHVRQVLLAHGVDVEVLRAAVLADDHALVELVAGGDEQRAALLQRGQREPGRLARSGRRRATRSGACAARRTTAPSRRRRDG